MPPWEKYQKPGPWNGYASSSQAAPKPVSELNPEEARARLHAVMAPGTGEGSPYIRPDAPLGQAAGHLAGMAATVLPFTMGPRVLGASAGATEGYEKGGVPGAVGGAAVGFARPGVTLGVVPAAEGAYDVVRGHPIRGALELAMAYLGGKSLKRLPAVAREVAAAQEAERAGQTLSAEKRALLETARARRAAQAEKTVSKIRGASKPAAPSGGDVAEFAPGASRVPPPQPPPPPSAEYVANIKKQAEARADRLKKFWEQKISAERAPETADILPKGQRAMGTNYGGKAKPGPPPTPPDQLEATLKASLKPKGSVVKMTRSATATAADEGEHVSEAVLDKAKDDFLEFVKKEGPKFRRGQRVYFVSDASGKPIQAFESGAAASGFTRRKANKGKYFIDFFENVGWGR